jgi:hypothetical protein
MEGGRRGEVSCGGGEEDEGEEGAAGAGFGDDGGHAEGGGGGHGDEIDLLRPWPRSLMSEISDMSMLPR